MDQQQMALFVSQCTGLPLDMLKDFDEEILGDIMEGYENQELEAPSNEKEEEVPAPKIALVRGVNDTVLLDGPLSMAAVRENTGLKHFTLHYVDKEGDEIVVQSDLEFVEAMDACQVDSLGFLPFFVEEVREEEEIEEEIKEEIKEEVKEEEVKEEVHEEFPIPDSFKAKVLELEILLKEMGCIGLSRGRLIEVLLENEMEVNEPLVIQLLEERLKVLEERKKAAKADLISFFSSPEGDLFLQRTAEKSLENSNDTVTNFVEVMEEFSKQ
jgi:hypothetical protein